ncbi:MAG: MBL fold metallo-hydrolase [Planctomyces sp.]
MLDVRVISIGTLPAHPLWGERTPIRTGHSTTTLIRSLDRTILIDPGLPERALAARLGERACITPDDVTHVFLTSFHPDTHRALTAFENARWFISRDEREGFGRQLVAMLTRASQGGDQELVRQLEHEVAILKRCEEAPHHLADGVEIYPLPGVTPGLCGVMISEDEAPTLITGDAVATIEHVRRQMVMPTCADVQQARASFADALEVADIIVPGRDNVMVVRQRGPMSPGLGGMIVGQDGPGGFGGGLGGGPGSGPDGGQDED